VLTASGARCPDPAPDHPYILTQTPARTLTRTPALSSLHGHLAKPPALVRSLRYCPSMSASARSCVLARTSQKLSVLGATPWNMSSACRASVGRLAEVTARRSRVEICLDRGLMLSSMCRQAHNAARQKWTPRTGSLRCPACHHVSYRVETLQRHLTGCCPDLFTAEVGGRVPLCLACVWY